MTDVVIQMIQSIKYEMFWNFFIVKVFETINKQTQKYYKQKTKALSFQIYVFLLQNIFKWSVGISYVIHNILVPFHPLFITLLGVDNQNPSLTEIIQQLKKKAEIYKNEY